MYSFYIEMRSNRWWKPYLWPGETWWDFLWFSIRFFCCPLIWLPLLVIGYLVFCAIRDLVS